MPAAVSCTGTLRKLTGPVTHYRRLRGKTVLTIGEEMITLRHRGGDDPSRFFLVNGTPFRYNDWNRIEVRKGELPEGNAGDGMVVRRGRDDHRLAALTEPRALSVADRAGGNFSRQSRRSLLQSAVGRARVECAAVSGTVRGLA